MSDKIFGYKWDDIKRAQQGGSLRKPLPTYEKQQHAKMVQSDVDRFKIPVFEIVRSELNIDLPEGYIRNGDRWEHPNSDHSCGEKPDTEED